MPHYIFILISSHDADATDGDGDHEMEGVDDPNCVRMIDWRNGPNPHDKRVRAVIVGYEVLQHRDKYVVI